MKKNYIDEKGNYINVENLSLAEIYNRGREEGYKKGYVDGSLKTPNPMTETADELFLKIKGGGT